MTHENNLERLALFPLNTVLFPSTRINLHIFEEKFKLMFEHVLNTDKIFGVVHHDKQYNGIAQIGCVAKVQDVLKFPDGRLNIVASGIERFKITDINQTVPYITANVETIPERAVDGRTLLLAHELRTLIDDVLALSSKVYGKPKPEADEIPTDPVSLSYTVPHAYYGSLEEQQHILSLETAEDRLVEEIGLLDAARKHFAALSSIQNAVG